MSFIKKELKLVYDIYIKEILDVLILYEKLKCFWLYIKSMRRDRIGVLGF